MVWRPKLVGSACVRVHCTVALSFMFTELCCTDSTIPADASEMKERMNLRRRFLSANTFSEGNSQKLFTAGHGHGMLMTVGGRKT
jgi:hypothetical protein